MLIYFKLIFLLFVFINNICLCIIFKKIILLFHQLTCFLCFFPFISLSNSYAQSSHLSLATLCVALSRCASYKPSIFFCLMHTCVEKNCKSSHKKLLCCCFLYSFFLSANYVIYNYMHTYIQHLLLTIIYKCRLAIKLPHKQICIHTNICT